MCLMASTRKSWRLPRLRPKHGRRSWSTCTGVS
nr:MAG TPA: hypothetical protein [Caudoviricetes sp.]